MDILSLLKMVVERLDELKIPHMLTGGLAVSFWGRPRTTHDIDIVIEARMEDKEKIINAFKRDFYVSEEAVEDAIKKNFTFNIIHYKSGLKVNFWLIKKDPHKTLEFKKRLKKRILGKKIYLVSPEDLILEKLLWYKESKSTRHLEDIEGILKISKPDLNYIKRWAKQQSTIGILEDLIKRKV